MAIAAAVLLHELSAVRVCVTSYAGAISDRNIVRAVGGTPVAIGTDDLTSLAKFRSRFSVEDSECFHLLVHLSERNRADERDPGLFVEMDIVEIQPVDFREFVHFVRRERAGQARAITIRQMTCFADTPRNVRRVMQVAGELRVPAHQGQPFARVIDQCLMMTVMACRELAVNAALPADRSVIMNMARGAEFVVLPNVLIKFVSRNRADQGPEQKPRREDERESAEEGEKVFHQIPPCGRTR